MCAQDVVVTVGGIEQLRFETLRELCDIFHVSDVYCDFSGKQTHVVVERTNTKLMEKYKKVAVESTDKSTNNAPVQHPEMSQLKSVAKVDEKVISDVLTNIKRTFETGTFTKMTLELVNRPGMVTIHISDVRRVPAGFILASCNSGLASCVDFERRLVRIDVEKTRKPVNVV